MKTILVSHAWLENPDPNYRGRRVQRWLKHYGGCWPVEIIDNGSKREKYDHFDNDGLPLWVSSLYPNYPRGGPLDYPNVWRAYWYIRDHILNKYERVFYIATDAYVCSQRLMDYLLGIESGWTALWCPKYQFPEAQIQVITRCKEFLEFFSGDCDPFKYNYQVEEALLPFTRKEKGFVGDRYGEDLIPYRPEMDYYCQVPDAPDWDDSMFPIVRRINGRVTVCDPS